MPQRKPLPDLVQDLLEKVDKLELDKKEKDDKIERLEMKIEILEKQILDYLTISSDSRTFQQKVFGD